PTHTPGGRGVGVAPPGVGVALPGVDVGVGVPPEGAPGMQRPRCISPRLTPSQRLWLEQTLKSSQAPPMLAGSQAPLLLQRSQVPKHFGASRSQLPLAKLQLSVHGSPSVSAQTLSAGRQTAGDGNPGTPKMRQVPVRQLMPGSHALPSWAERKGV